MPLTRSRQQVAVYAWIGLVAALMGYRFFHFIGKYAVNIPFWDQWDFLTSFFPGGHPTLKTLFFWQHGPHREGLGLIADKFLYAATAWNIRAESFFIGGCIFAAMLAALALVHRLFDGFTWTDALIPIMFLTLVQWDTMIGTPNPGYGSMPLLLIMLYALALLQPHYLVRYTLLLLLDFPLIYTGFGIFMGIVTIGVFALECYWRLRRSTDVPLGAPVAGFALACAFQGSYLLNYTFRPAADCFTFPHAPFKPYLIFFNVMFANYSGIWIPQDYGWMPPEQMMAIAGTAPAVILGAVFLIQAWRVLKPNPDRRVALAVMVLLTYSGLFALNAAVGRVCLGPGGAFTSRYATLLIPAFLGLYLFARDIRIPVIRQLAMAVLAILVIPGSVITPDSYRYYALGKRAWAECYVEKGDIAACDAATHFQIYPYPGPTHLQEKLDYLKERRLSLFADK